MKSKFNRRVASVGVSYLLAGCVAHTQQTAGISFPHLQAYGPAIDEPYLIPGLDLNQVNHELLRQQVPFAGPYRPGTIVVDVTEKRLYLVEPGGRAMRYAVGVGREQALNFHGTAIIGRKAEWPSWTPTESMIKRIPRYGAYASGMQGGINNPLGARALYLYRGSQDTHFRLHGTNDPTSIGKAVSSGCIRLFNQDIIDLYNRVPRGAPVFVLQQ
jgi:lipoprotein-anchoring transpeptidase ErfK/SrfK